MSISSSAEAERCFERFCANLSLQCERVIESSAQRERRPDYSLIGFDRTRLLVEVKLVSPSPSEADELARLRAGEIFARRIVPGERLRRMIADANGQLRQRAGAGLPGVLVVFCADPFLRNHLDPYSVLTAMRGLDEIPVTVHRDPSIPPVFGEVRSGPRKSMTEIKNRSTSAVILPRQDESADWQLSVFLNRFARITLPRTAFEHPRVRHFEIRPDERDWQSVPAAC
ncbi:MAG: hypothetical protein ACK5ZS_01710 [bacterium]|jgi:hypothetical protein